MSMADWPSTGWEYNGQIYSIYHIYVLYILYVLYICMNVYIYMEWCVYKHMLLDVVVGPGCLCLPQHLHLFIYARLQYIGETLRAVALLDNLSFFCIQPRHMSACVPPCRPWGVWYSLSWEQEFVCFCVGLIWISLCALEMVAFVVALWPPRLYTNCAICDKHVCIRHSHALTFLLHSNTSIIVVSSQVNSLMMQLNYLIQSDTNSEQRNCGNIKSRPIGKSPEKFYVLVFRWKSSFQIIFMLMSNPSHITKSLWIDLSNSCVFLFSRYVFLNFI